MLSWTFLPLDYKALPTANDVFVRETEPFDANTLGKTLPTRKSVRQAHFEGLLRDIAWHLGSRTVPVFVSFNGDQRRMDKGCVGVAVAAKFLEQPVNGPEGYVTDVTLATDMVRKVTFEDHAAYTDEPRRKILYELRRRVLALDERLRNGEVCTSRQRIAYSLPGTKLFLEVKVQSAAIVLHLIDGGIPDHDGITTDIPKPYGWGDLAKRINLVGYGR